MTFGQKVFVWASGITLAVTVSIALAIILGPLGTLIGFGIGYLTGSSLIRITR